MEIISDDKKLLKQASCKAVGQKELGVVMAKKLQLRIKELESVDTIDDLLSGPGRWELLQHNRAGTYSGRLNGNYRLIVRFLEIIPASQNKAKPVVSAKPLVVALLEIIDYHEKKNFR